jgi:hypothetical protein
MIKKILLTFLALILVLVLVGLFLPERYRCTRSVVIRAPAEKIHLLISDLKAWPEWEPFSEGNPDMKVMLGETTSGVGASQSWDGTADKGRLTITKSDPSTGIEYDLVFVNGSNEAHAKSWMRMKQVTDTSTEIDWGIEGKMNMPVIGGYFALAADWLMGPMFERGLEKLKAKAEAK